jgi:outer membrane receptor protein involved in Fe transport
MQARTQTRSRLGMWQWLSALLAVGAMLLPRTADAQGLTGALVGTVKDEQGAVLPGALVRVTSSSLIGGPATTTTNERGQPRFPVLLPGSYVVDVEVPGFGPYHEEDIYIGAGATLSRTVVLKLAGIAESIVVEGSGSRIETRGSGFETRFGSEYLKAIPTRRFSMFDAIRAAPGVSQLWDIRVGRFVYSRTDDPSTGDRTTSGRFDRVTGVSSGNVPQFGASTLIRTTAKATLSHYQRGLFAADHEWKIGTSLEKGEHYQPQVIPGGVRFVDSNGQPFQAISSPPSKTGGQFITAAAFASDALTIGDRLTINLGVRFDHSRAISQDLNAVDAERWETGDIIRGSGTLYTWNVVSPRLGVTAKLSADGRTMLRASYGRFNQGVLTGEISPIHPGAAPVTTTAFDAATGGYTTLVSVVDPKVNLLIDPQTRTPRTDEYSIGVDRELGSRLSLALAYIRKSGGNFITWTDVGGTQGATSYSVDCQADHCRMLLDLV